MLHLKTEKFSIIYHKDRCFYFRALLLQKRHRQQTHRKDLSIVKINKMLKSCLENRILSRIRPRSYIFTLTVVLDNELLEAGLCLNTEHMVTRSNVDSLLFSSAVNEFQ